MPDMIRPSREINALKNKAFDLALELDSQGREIDAIHSLRRAAELGHEEAAQALGHRLTEEGASPETALEGVKWFLKSLEMVEVDGWAFCHDDDPIERGLGWTGWPFLGELIARLSVEQAVEVVRLVKLENDRYRSTLAD